jgi:signal peptidase I
MHSVKIGFSINEILFLISLATGLCWLAWRLKLRRMSEPPARKPLWVTFGSELFVVVALMFTCRIALADWPKVPSGSMEPTLRVGDYLLVNHLAYGPRLPFTNTAIEMGQPQRGDVVVFRYPLDVSQFYVKRLIGLPGDRIRFKDGIVSVNGEPFDSQVVGDGEADEDQGKVLVRETAGGNSRTLKINPMVQGKERLNVAEVPALAQNCMVERDGLWECQVPPGQYLMLGDNRDNSADSREWGFMPHEEIYGKAVRVLINFSDLKRAWTAL